ncbi:LamG-like jellyroll fold domain-containing protein [Aestuariivivens insulae]|uniref:LamG-like jellyroll fold domain-containing protein n=1 Tax=Aestuariivivens insulae TaxID=1621988 RepID=UPI001F59BA61|nr:LamG-like jellyroll fold domain-containing protein [Aestuariivivens insulae]
MKRNITFWRTALCLGMSIILGYNIQAQDANLVARYNFTNNYNDSSASGLNLTATGTITYVDDKDATANSAINVGNTTSYLTSSANSPISGTMARTYTAWFKSTDTNGFKGIVGQGSGADTKFTLGISGAFYGDVLLLDLGNKDIRYGDAASNQDNNWHFAACTYVNNGDGTGTARLYFDFDGSGNVVEVAQVVNDAAWGNNVNTAVAPLAVGTDGTSTSRGFNGSLDDVRVYSRVLTPAELTQVKNGNTLSLKNSIFSSHKIEAFPTRVEEVLNFKMDLVAPITISIYSVVGKQILSTQYKDHAGNIQIDFDGYSAGLYIAKLESEGKSGTIKFIKN